MTIYILIIIIGFAAGYLCGWVISGFVKGMPKE